MTSLRSILQNLEQSQLLLTGDDDDPMEEDDEVLDSGKVETLDHYKNLIFRLYCDPCNCSTNFMLRVVRDSDGLPLARSLNIEKMVSEFPHIYEYEPEVLPAMKGRQELREYLLKNVAPLHFSNMSTIYTGARDPISALIMINNLTSRLSHETNLCFDYSNFKVSTMVFSVNARVWVDLELMASFMPHSVTLELIGPNAFPSACVTFGIEEFEEAPKKKRKSPVAIIANTGNSIVTGVRTIPEAKEVAFCTYLLSILFERGKVVEREKLKAIVHRMKNLSQSF
jgi:TATA-box binding protein (TBP) (component of TFIID and TFIIIB)